MNRAHWLWISLLTIWALTQLFYGAVAPWAQAASAAALGALYLVARVVIPEPLRISRAALAWMAAVAAVFLVQFLPIPFLFPHASAMRRAHGVGLMWPGTADAHQTARVLAQACAYVLSALLVLKLRQSGLRSSGVLKGAVAVLALQALYAAAQAAFDMKEIPFYGPRHYTAASGTLVNRNNFAGLMAMGIAAAAGLACLNFIYGRRRPGEPIWNRRIETGLLWGLAGALFAAGIVMSQSRGGAVAALVGLAALPFLWRGKASAAGVLSLLVAGAAAVLLAHPGGLIERFGRMDPFELTSDQRVRLWETTAAASLRQPVLGFGAGTHKIAYHPFQPVDIPGQPDHAHSEYVNAFFEGGAVLTLVLLAGLAAWFVRVWRGLKALQGPDRIAPLAAMAAVLAEAVHSLVDFDLRITSAGMLFGMMVAVGASKLRAGAVWRRDWVPGAAGLAAAAALAILPLDPGPRLEGSEEALKRAAGLSPYDHRVAWKLARRAQERGDREEADRRFLVAADLWPAHGDVQREAGLWFWEGYEETGDLDFRNRASLCLGRLFLQRPQAACEVMEEIWDPDRPLVDYEALLPPAPAPAAHMAGFLVRRALWTEGMALFDKFCGGNAAAHDVFAAALESAGQWGLEAVVRERRLAVESDAWAHAAAARAWLRLGELSKALERAEMASRIEPLGPAWHALRGDVLRARGRRMEAAEAYGEAIRAAPMELGYRMARASTYLELEMPSPAAEDFREILRSRPDDRRAVLGLARALLALGNRASARIVLDGFLSRLPGDAEAKRLRESIRE